jgi:Golgi apparatus protein 1
MPRHALLAAALLALATAAGAEDACTAAVNRLCPRSRGDLLVLGCLRSHEAELQAACRGDLDLLLAKARDIGADCEGDVAKLCKDVQPGEGRVATCLKDNESHLSSGCQSAFNEWRLLRMELTAACAGDVGRWCKDVPPGAGRVWRCLEEHEAQLGSDCRSALKKL